MIPLFKPYVSSELNELADILNSGALAYGKWGRLFEQHLKNYLGVENIVTTSSYNSAMLVLLATLGLNPGDEVIASPMSCLASNQPFLNRKLKVKWVDIDPETGTIDPDSLLTSISAKSKAVFHNHHCGIPGYIDEVNTLAREHGLFCVDDCIEAFGSEYKGKIIGETGSDASIYSFQTIRLPNTIDGGAVAFGNPELYNKALLSRDYGINRSNFRDELNEISPLCDIDVEGYGALMSEVNSYLGCQQMKEIDGLIKQQRDNAERWNAYFRDNYPDIKSLGSREGILPNFWVYSILTDDKNDLMKKFREIGYYASGVHLNNNAYSAFGPKQTLKGVDKFMQRHLALPCGWWFTNTI